MSFTVKLLLFVVTVIAIGLLLRHFPNSKLTQLLCRWYGPVPKDDELKSRFLFRWSWYAFRWFIVLGIVTMTGLVTGFYLHDDPAENTYFVLFFLFGFPMLLGMAFLGGILCFVKGCFIRAFRGNLRFDDVRKQFIEKA